MDEKKVARLVKLYKKVNLIAKRKIVLIIIQQHFIKPLEKPMAYLKGRDIIDVVNEYNFFWEQFCNESEYQNHNLFMGMVFKLYPKYINELRAE